MAKTLIPRKTNLSKNIRLKIYVSLVSRQAHVQQSFDFFYYFNCCIKIVLRVIQ